MTLQELINQAEGRDLSKSYPKSDDLYIWDYKLVDTTNLELIQSNSGKAGFIDKVSIQELLDYITAEFYDSPIEVSLNEMKITGAELITIAKI